MPTNLPSDLLERIQQHGRQWQLVIEDSFETETSVISFVSRDERALVLKTVKTPGDEWNAGQVLAAFGGKGVVRVCEYTSGAMLLERLQPGTSLSEIGDDREATAILAGVMRQMSPREPPHGSPTVADWGKGFERYLDRGDEPISRNLVALAQHVFGDLCASQTNARLLHGDLHHYNVLLDENRGWVAIDPKGVIGEAEYEIGAALRNPVERPEEFLSRAVIERRLEQFVDLLNLDYQRTVSWAFAQAVLSAIWNLEDGQRVSATDSALQLAEITRPMVQP